jgi:hypothetical protein
MLQAFIDLFPDCVNEYGLLGCIGFSLSLLTGLVALAQAIRERV